MLFEKTPPCWNKIGALAAVGLAFAIPVSTALTTVLLIIVALAWLLGSDGAQKRALLWDHPLVKWIYPFVLLALWGSTYSIGDEKAIHESLRDSLRFLSIPVLFYFYRAQTVRDWALWVFTGAMVLTLLLVFMKVYGGLPIGSKYTAGAVFKDHIKTGFLMTMAVLFLAQQARHHSALWVRGVCVGIAGLMVYHLLFINVGRIGYVGVAMVLCILAWQWGRVKGVIGGLCLATLLLGGAYMSSASFSQRINSLQADWEYYQQVSAGEDSSLGLRIDFAKAGLALLAERPLQGWGTGSFAQAYAQYHPDSAVSTDNPHNEFLRMGTEYGSMGIVLLLLLFYHQARLSTQLARKEREYFQGLLCVFILGCLANSWLKDSTEGNFYCVMSAIVFASLAPSQKQALGSAHKKAIVH